MWASKIESFWIRKIFCAHLKNVPIIFTTKMYAWRHLVEFISRLRTLLRTCQGSVWMKKYFPTITSNQNELLSSRNYLSPELSFLLFAFCCCCCFFLLLFVCLLLLFLVCFVYSCVFPQFFFLSFFSSLVSLPYFLSPLASFLPFFYYFFFSSVFLIWLIQ